MSKLDDLNAKLDRQDAAIADVTADLHFVKDQMAGGLSSAEADTLSARLDGSIAKLEALGAETDSSTPPPVEPPVEPAP